MSQPRKILATLVELTGVGISAQQSLAESQGLKLQGKEQAWCGWFLVTMGERREHAGWVGIGLPVSPDPKGSQWTGKAFHCSAQEDAALGLLVKLWANIAGRPVMSGQL